MESISPKEAFSKPVMMDISKLKFWEKPGDEHIEVSVMLSLWDDTMMQFYPVTASKVENVSYLKLKTITLGYTLPEHLVKKIHISGLRLFLTGENLFTITNYSGGPTPRRYHLDKKALALITTMPTHWPRKDNPWLLSINL